MTIEKAIGTLKKYYDSALLKIHIDFLQNPKKYQNDGVPNNFIRETESVRLALDDAITALEKQVPKKAERKNKTFYCPTCHNVLSIARRCIDCGQLLKWPEAKR